MITDHGKMRLKKHFASWLAWTLVVFCVVCFVISMNLSASIPLSMIGPHSVLWPVNPVNLSLLTYAVIGAFIATRRSQNPIGWIFLAIGLSSVVFHLADAYVSSSNLNASVSFHGTFLLLWLPLNLWVVTYCICPLLLLLFPNGQLPSPHWKPIVWLLIAGIFTGLAGSGALVENGSLHLQFPSLVELLGIGSVQDTLQSVTGISILITACSGVAAIIFRIRHASYEERQQLKWFSYAGLIFAVILIAEQAFFDQLRLLDPSALLPADLLWGIPSAIAFVFIPIAAAIAILRYRLYDIDIIIRRTLIYALLTAALAVVYFSSVLLLQQVFRSTTGNTSPVAIVISTLAIAALFTPLRKRVQDFIDQRFYRRKYDVARIMDTFSAAVREQVELEKLTYLLVNLVNEVVQPESLSLWFATSLNAKPANSPEGNTNIYS